MDNLSLSIEAIGRYSISVIQTTYTDKKNLCEKSMQNYGKIVLPHDIEGVLSITICAESQLEVRSISYVTDSLPVKE